MSGSNKMSDSDWEESEQEINGVKYRVLTNNKLVFKKDEIKFHIDPDVVSVGNFWFYIPKQKG